MAIDLDDGDWIPVFRKLRESWIWKDAETVRAWMDILMMANRRESKFRFRGAVLEVEPGQLATTYQSLAKRWGWSRARVQRFIAALDKDQTIQLRRLEYVRVEPTQSEHQNVHVDVHVKGTTTDTKAGTWKDSESDRSIALLTIVNSPVRTKWLAKRTRENIVERSPERAREQAPDGHLTERSTLHNPRGREGETTTAGQGETGERPQKPQEAPQAPAPPARGDGDGGGAAAVAVESPAGGDGTDGGVQEAAATPPAEARDPALAKISGTRGAALLEGVGVEPSLAHSLALQRPVGDVLDICLEARGKRKPAGFARRAIEQGWRSPVATGPEVQELVELLRADASTIETRFRKLAGDGLLLPAKGRLAGESDEDYWKRIQDAARKRSRGVQG